MERSGSSGVMAVMVVALVAILVVFLLVSGVFAPTTLERLPSYV